MNNCWPFFKSAAVANGVFLGITYSGSTCAIAVRATNNVKHIRRMLGIVFESRVYHSVGISQLPWRSARSLAVSRGTRKDGEYGTLRHNFLPDGLARSISLLQELGGESDGPSVGRTTPYRFGRRSQFHRRHREAHGGQH